MNDTDDAALQEARQRLGRRIAQLRELRGYSQSEFAKRFGLSKSWLSMAERGQLNPSAKKLHQLAAALQVPLGALTVDVDLEPEEAAGLALAEHYFHWSRLNLAQAIFRNDQDIERGRRMMSSTHELADALHAEPRYAALLNSFMMQSPAALPEASRWLLLIELAACDPFAPFEFVFDALRSRIYEELPYFAAELGLPSGTQGSHQSSAAVKMVSDAYDRRATSATWEQLRLPPGPVPAVMPRAAPGVVAPMLRGRDLVGWAGWSVAGGLYLVRDFNAATPAISTAGMTLPVWTIGSMAGSMFKHWQAVSVAAAAANVVGPALGAVRASHPPLLGSQSVPRPDDASADGAAVADFLLALGPHWARHELGKLEVTVDVVIRPRRPTDPALEPYPELATVLSALHSISVDLEERLSREERLNDSDTPRVNAIKEIISAVGETAQSIASRETV